METKITPMTGGGCFLNSLFRGFRRKTTTEESLAPTVAFCIPAGIVIYALFEEGAPCASLEREEKAKLYEAIEERLFECGWSVEMSKKALDLKDREYQRRFRELSKHGGVFIDHIKNLIDRAYEYRHGLEHMGRGIPYPWPIREAANGSSEKALL